jgi:hypothetical protein
MAGDKNNTVLRPSGTIIITDPDLGVIMADTLQCCHCGAHWTVVKGSGRERGFCLKCMGPTCGPNCLECVPQEQWLENSEKGRPENHRDIIVSVPRSIG